MRSRTLLLASLLTTSGCNACDALGAAVGGPLGGIISECESETNRTLGAYLDHITRMRRGTVPAGAWKNHLEDGGFYTLAEGQDDAGARMTLFMRGALRSFRIPEQGNTGCGPSAIMVLTADGGFSFLNGQLINQDIDG